MKFKYGKVPDNFFNKTQLKMGIAVELEHTNSKSVAKEISKAHLKENPRYYTYLKQMEKKMNKR